MNNTITPYDILGVPTNASIHQINTAYRNLILQLHPDKKSKIKWSNDERKEAFIRVRKAYKDITKNYNFKDVPEYNLEYQDWDEVVNPKDTTTKDFDIDHFNKQFELNKQKIKKHEMEDPYTRGYKEFDRRPNDPKKHLKSLKSQPKVRKPQKTKHQLVIHNPDTQTNTTNNCYEFGLTKISDFSITTQSKNGLSGCDLGSVYDQDNEYWEDSFNRHQKFSKKYNDTTDISTKVKKMQFERSRLDIKEEYKKAEELERIEKEKIARQFEHNRQLQLQRDEFFRNIHSLKY